MSICLLALLVGWFVSKIHPKLLNRFPPHLDGGFVSAQNMPFQLLLQIWIKGWIPEVPVNPKAKSYLLLHIYKFPVKIVRQVWPYRLYQWHFFGQQLKVNELNADRCGTLPDQELLVNTALSDKRAGQTQLHMVASEIDPANLTTGNGMPSRPGSRLP